MTDERVEVEDVSLVAALPGLARIGAVASIRLAEWTATVYLRTASRLVRAAAGGDAAGEILERTGEDLLAYVRELLVGGMDGRATATPEPVAPEPVVVVEADERPTQTALRERGAELLRRSADLAVEEDEAHPAYARILEEIAPDEARILRLLVLEGPQPSVDVRTGGPIGMLKDELVAPGLSMIAMEGGLRRPEHVARHLHNLYRLGLIWFSREQLDDPTRYQVLEAQPDVADAMAEAGRARTIRRSIHLTPFGDDFCRTCLPLDTVEIDALAPDT
jgi:abortive infection alpha-like protein